MKAQTQKVSKFFKEFKSFIEKGNAIDMAVGIIVGSAMTGVVNSLVKDVIMPPIGFLLGGIDFSQFFIVLKPGNDGGYIYNTIAAAQSAGASTLNIGLFINTLISFVITMFAIFMLVRVVNKVKGKEEQKEVKKTKSCPYCYSKINIKAVRCPSCCSDIKELDKKKAVIKVKK